MELSRVEHILKYFLGEEATLPQPLSRVEELLIALGRLIEEGKVTNPISIRDRVNTIDDLPSNAEPGWLYFVGLATDTEFTEYIYLDSGRWEYLGTSMISIDTALSTTSANPVQNSTITNAINTINELLAKKPGEITTGKQYVIDGQTVTADTGAEAFNNLVNNKAAGRYSHAEGGGTTASGAVSHAEGSEAKAYGAVSHAEGSNTTALGLMSHAEGSSTTASGVTSHAEGSSTTASGVTSHAEGSRTTASGDNSHSEGDGTKALSANQHVQGKFNVEDANSTYAFIIGNGTGNSARHNAFAIDWNGLIYVNGAATGVDLTKKPGEITTGKQYVIGGQTVTAGTGAEVFNDLGNNKASGPYSHAEGTYTTASGVNSHSEGGGTKALGANSHSEGAGTTASGSASHAEGSGTTASGDNSHSEGGGTTASGSASHAEGSGTTASGDNSHSEGGGTKALGANSHSEGAGTTASGANSHAEGQATIASGDYSHTEGNGTTASGAQSHAEGVYTKASSAIQHVQGKFNVEDTNGTYAFIIGNGTGNNARHNAFAVDWNGLIYVNGAATGVNVSALPTSADLNSKVSTSDVITTAEIDEMFE